ncbi:MAG: outer membrane lipoprotein carrier protein LolA [Prevotellaceae bacterium]|nr:outer membrane lipoprotein carrier protein LolA [Prevotellaceae bacterium]
MKNFLLAVFTFAAGISTKAQVVSDSDGVILDKIKLANEKCVSITSDFKQSKHIAHMSNDVVSQGSFFYEKPDKLAMHYTSPAGDIMLMNGEHCLMSNSGKVTSASLKSNAKIRRIKAILSASLSGNVREMSAKKITCVENAKYIVVTVEINENSKKGVINKVTVSYDIADYSPSNLKTEEPDGSYTVYELIDKKLNQDIDPNLFNTKKVKK